MLDVVVVVIVLAGGVVVGVVVIVVLVVVVVVDVSAVMGAKQDCGALSKFGTCTVS